MITLFSGFRAKLAQSSPRIRLKIYICGALAIGTILFCSVLCRSTQVSPSDLSTQTQDLPEPNNNDSAAIQTKRGSDQNSLLTMKKELTRLTYGKNMFCFVVVAIVGLVIIIIRWKHLAIVVDFFILTIFR